MISVVCDICRQEAVSTLHSSVHAKMCTADFRRPAIRSHPDAMHCLLRVRTAAQRLHGSCREKNPAYVCYYQDMGNMGRKDKVAASKFC